MTPRDLIRRNRRTGTAFGSATLLRTGLVLALLAALLAGAEARWLSIRQPPWYVATKTLLATEDGPVYRDLGVPSPRPIDAMAYRAAVMSGPVASTALGDLLGRAPSVAELQYFLRHTRVEVERRERSSLIRIRSTSANADAARREVRAVANALIAWEVQRSSSALSQGAAVLSDNIDSIERVLESDTSNGQPLTTAQRTSLQTLLAQRTRERDSMLARIDARVRLGLLSPLAEGGGSVTAVHQGAVPKMLLSGAFAFAATLAAILVHMALNPRDRTREDIVALAGVPVLAELSLLPWPSQDVDPEGVDLLRSMLLREAQPGQVSVLCVTSARNPDSTHDVSIKLAASMARLGRRTLLVDSDMRRPSLASKMSPNPNRVAPLEEHLQSPGVNPIPANIHLSSGLSYDFIPTYAPAENPQELLERSFEQRVAYWRRNYDFIVIEGPPVVSFADTMTIASACTALVLCADPIGTDPEDITRARDLLGRFPVRLVGLLVTYTARRTPAPGRRPSADRLDA
jgi:Mrp family chromosome partitioning ATPase